MRELRGELSGAAVFGETVDQVLRPGGYRLAGVFAEGSPDVVVRRAFPYR